MATLLRGTPPKGSHAGLQRQGEEDGAEGEDGNPDEEGREEDSEGGEGEVEGEASQWAGARGGSQAEEEA